MTNIVTANNTRLSDLIAICRIGWKEFSINNTNFPFVVVPAAASVMQTFRLENLGKETMTKDEIEASLGRLNYRAATIHELLIWGATPSWNGHDTVIALGSVHQNVNGIVGMYEVPCLDNIDGDRALNVVNCRKPAERWSEKMFPRYFLAVPK